MSYQDEIEKAFEELFDSMDEKEVEELLDNIISLTDEEGNDVHFEFLDLIEYKGSEYVVLSPLEDDGSGEVVILEVENSGEETETYASVDDMDLLTEVYEVFKEKFKDEFIFTE